MAQQAQITKSAGESGFQQLLLQIAQAVLLITQGCASGKLIGESRLAGAWVLVDGAQHVSIQGRHEERDLPPWSSDKPYLVIRPDGSFYVIEGSSAAWLDQLQNEGDLFEGAEHTISVTRRRYAPELTEVRLRMRDRAEAQEHNILFAARLARDGTLSFRRVLPFQSADVITDAKLKRIEGLRPWDPPGLIREWTGHQGPVTAAEYSADGRYVISAGDKTIRLWDLDTGAEVRRFVGHTSQVADVDFSPDGRRFVSGSYEPMSDKPEDDDSVRIWDVETGQQIQQIKGFKLLSSVDYSPDGRHVLASGSLPSVDVRTTWEQGLPAVRIWDAETGRLCSEAYHACTARDAVFLPTGESTLCSMRDGPLCVVSMEAGAPMRCFGPPVSDDRTGGKKVLCLSPDGGRVLAVGHANHVHEWNIEDGRELHCATVNSNRTTRAVYLPDGKRILIGDCEGGIRMWDLQANIELHRFEGHRDSVSDIAVSPDGRRFVSCCRDGTIRLWQLPEE